MTKFHVIESPVIVQLEFVVNVPVWCRKLRCVAMQTNLKLTLVHSNHHCLIDYTAIFISFTADCSRISQLDDINYTLLTSFLFFEPVTCGFCIFKRISQVTFEYEHKKLNCDIKIFKFKLFSLGSNRSSGFQLENIFTVGVGDTNMMNVLTAD